MKRYTFEYIKLILLMSSLLSCQEAPSTKATDDTSSEEINFRGFDHFMWAVRDLDGAESFFRDTLGFDFTGSRNDMETLENFLIWFPDETYLEPLTPLHPNDAFANAMRNWLKVHEGAWKIGFNAEPLEPIYEKLVSLGYRTFDPSPGTFIKMNDRSDIANDMWKGLSFTTPPGNYIFFWHFTDGWNNMKRAVPDIDPTTISKHRNTAMGIKSGWVAVWDLNQSAKIYEQMGMPAAGQPFEIPHLSAMGRRIELPMGDLILVQPRYYYSPVIDFLFQRGENLFGVSIEVENLEQARDVISTGLNEQISTYDGIDGKSMLIPASKAHGVYMEFFQK